MREIVLDTETTGLDPYQGHRLVEIGCIELVNRIPSGQTFHRYVNPHRDIPAEALAVHGLTAEFLRARRKHPAGPNRLDDLCGRYGIDNTRRVKHGALLDAELLAEVYLELIGARQAQLILSQAPAIVMPGEIIAVRERPAPLPSRLTADAQAAHRRFIASLGENA